MKTVYLYSMAFITFLLAASCEEKTTWELNQSGIFPVAECILTNELKYQEVKLFYSVIALNEDPAGVPGALVAVDDGNTRVEFIPDPQETGFYISVVPFRASAGLTYRLTITAEGIADTARAAMTGVTPLDDVDIVQADSLFRFVYHNSQSASMTEIRYDWSGNLSYCGYYGSCEAAEVFYTLENIDPSKEFAPIRQKILFPKGTRIVRKKYSLSEEHQQFIRALLLETDWRGGLFDTEQGNVPTNFHHGIRGWFAVSAVVSDTTDFQ